MADDRTEILMGAQKFLTARVEKELGPRTTGVVWGSKSLNLKPGEHGLVIRRGGEKRMFTFTQAELTDGYESLKWSRHLLARVDEIVRKMEG